MKEAPLSTPVQFVKGVGPALAQRLAKLNIFTVEDLFYHIPLRYVDRRQIYPLAKVPLGKERTVIGQIVSGGPVLFGGRGKQAYEILLKDGTGTISAKWFHFFSSRMKQLFTTGRKVLLAGEVTAYRGKLQMIHPDFEILEEGEGAQEIAGKILPVYPLTEGLYQKTLRRIIRNAWDTYGKFLRPALPLEFSEKYNLADPWQSIDLLHFPSSDINFGLLNERKTPAHQTLIFDEFFFLELGLALKRARVVKHDGIPFPFRQKIFDDFVGSLPFQLTPAQNRVLAEIRHDMEAPNPMNRLLQGDVGSGKTVVAIASALQAIANGYQVAIMAPTEILAEQHFETVSRLLQPLGVPVAVLTSALKGKEKKKVIGDLQQGEIPLVIGTHALLEENVQFAKLGLVVIDEQHRFGVLQRQILHKKGVHPDVLVMTATPIPRTLAMTAYGDLDVSVIDELPKGRRPILTRLYGEKQREQLYQGIRKELEKGHQAFVVYPLIEESEKLDLKNATEMSAVLKEIFEPQYKVELLHGRMPPVQKDAVMHDFKNQKIHVLAATSVVEVGVDCPNATVMVVEHAERFGLSQLHQLRGRVGRASFPSYCILMADYRRSEDAKRRLQVMTETTDGFKIAEVDLEIRGPGEFLGTRQSGLPEFRVGNIARDIDILSEARKGAFELIEKDPDLRLPEHQPFKEILKTRWKGKLELVQVS